MQNINGRFVVLDGAIQSSLKLLASKQLYISANLENPYAIDIDQQIISLALNNFRFSSIHWNNFFSNKTKLVDFETEKLEQFLICYFNADKSLLADADQKPNKDTEHTMKSIEISDQEDSMHITIDGVTDKNHKANITIKKGTTKEEHTLFVKTIPSEGNGEPNDYYLYRNELEQHRSEIAEAYINYRTDLFLQEILSFFIRYPNKIDELIPNTGDPIKDELDLSIRIESVITRKPSYNTIKLLLKLYGALGNLLTKEEEIWDLLIPRMTNTEMKNFNYLVNFKPEEIIESAGLTTIRSELSGFLTLNLSEGIDVFEDIVTISSLFI